jgi:ATP-dependent DNA helicase RecG
VERKGGLGEFTVVFHKDIFNEEELRKRGLNERQIKAVMYVKEKGKITNKEYQELNAVSNKTAFLELSDLKEKNFLITKGSGRSLIYTIKVTKR